MKSIKYDNFVYMTICEISFDLFKIQILITLNATNRH